MWSHGPNISFLTLPFFVYCAADKYALEAASQSIAVEVVVLPVSCRVIICISDRCNLQYCNG